GSPGIAIRWLTASSDTKRGCAPPTENCSQIGASVLAVPAVASREAPSILLPAPIRDESTARVQPSPSVRPAEPEALASAKTTRVSRPAASLPAPEMKASDLVVLA